MTETGAPLNGNLLIHLRQFIYFIYDVQVNSLQNDLRDPSVSTETVRSLKTQ